MSEQYACYIFVNKRLAMGKGKIGSQSAHGMRALCTRINLQSQYVKDSWEKWERNSDGRTILLYAKDEAEMNEIHNSYPSEEIHDAGMTQVPAGSYTILALYPKIHDPTEFKNKLVN